MPQKSRPHLSVFVGLVLITPWISPLAFGPSPAVVSWLVSLGCAGLAFQLSHFYKDDTAKVAARAWLIAALVSSVIGLIQYFGYSTAFLPWVNATQAGEAFGNLRQRNQFATLTNIGMASVLYFVGRRSTSAPKTILTSWPIAAVILLAAANASSSSRTGMIQLPVIAAMLVMWGRFEAAFEGKLIALAIAVYCAAILALPSLLGLDPSSYGILARLHEGPACLSRIVLWNNVLHLIAQRPWLGWGWGELDYAHFITLYPGPRFCDILDNAHNLPLHFAVELGIPVALLACGSGAWLMWKNKPWMETKPARQLAWLVLALILLHSLLEYPLWYGPFQIAVALCSLIIWSSRTDTQTGVSDAANTLANIGLPPSRLGKFVTGCVSAVLLVGVSYAAWDYHRISQIYLPPNARSSAYREDTLEKIRPSWLFRNQVKFAELTTTEVTATNAAQVNALAKEMLHFSPEARVAEKLIESAVVLERDDEALYYLARYRAAFPNEHARWAATMRLPAEPSASAK